MKLRTRQPSAASPGVVGTACVDRRITGVLRRAGAGDVVVMDHLDLDRTYAEALLERGVAAVVNSSPFISGRYPNLGPELLVKAGVVLVDLVDPDVFTRLKDGRPLRIDDGVVYAGEEPLASGRQLTLADVQEQMNQAREGLTTQLQSLAHNTTEFLRREQDLLLHGRGVPQLEVRMAGRPVVVVVRDFDHEADLKEIKRFIAEQKPVLVGVDAGADALLVAGLRPALVVVGEEGLGGGAGQGPVVSDRALTSAREVLVHADASGRLVGVDRLERLGVRPKRISATGTTADIAVLVADLEDASLIVLAGTHLDLDQFLDRQRAGLASTFLTRLRVGSRLVDARLVPTLYSGGVRLWQLALVVLVGLLAVAVAVGTTPVGADWAGALQDAAAELWDRIGELTR